MGCVTALTRAVPRGIGGRRTWADARAGRPNSFGRPARVPGAISLGGGRGRGGRRVGGVALAQRATRHSAP